MAQSHGALWTKRKGEKEYYAGSITMPFGVAAGAKIGIVIFPNDYKQKPTHPDYTILVNPPGEKK